MMSEAEEISKSILISLTIFIFPLFLKAIEFKSFYMYYLNQLSLIMKNELHHFKNYKYFEFFLEFG